MKGIEKLLLDTIGLDSESIGNNMVHRTVAQRMRAVGVENIDVYLKKLKQDPRELQYLIDAVTVPETWFFRDKEPFHMLASLVRSKWFPPSKTNPLRILSLPCATGEEPYSIAMVLKDMGYTAESVRIDAVDISMRALERAHQAVYGDNSFRGDEGDFQKKYFKRTKDGYVLSDAIRRMVNFRHGNLLHDFFLSGSSLYQIVFCRNVLIYFSREQQEKAIIKLHRLLAHDGVLFVGHAEGGRLLGDYFLSLKQAGTFAFQRRDVKLEPQDLQSVVANMVQPALHVHGEMGGKNRVINKRVTPEKSKKRDANSTTKLAQEAQEELQLMSTKPVMEHSVLDEVKKLADQGSLEQAGEICERFLASNSVSSDGYYLLGLIRQAEGKDTLAAELFRKAVYLDARHYQALVHLAVQAEYAGNIAAAVVYRSRASRVLTKK